MEPITLLRSTTTHAARNGYTVGVCVTRVRCFLRVISCEYIGLQFISLQAAVFVWIARDGPFVYNRGFHSVWAWPEYIFWDPEEQIPPGHVTVREQTDFAGTIVR